MYKGIILKIINIQNSQNINKIKDKQIYLNIIENSNIVINNLEEKLLIINIAEGKTANIYFFHNDANTVIFEGKGNINIFDEEAYIKNGQLRLLHRKYPEINSSNIFIFNNIDKVKFYFTNSFANTFLSNYHNKKINLKINNSDTDFFIFTPNFENVDINTIFNSFTIIGYYDTEGYTNAIELENKIEKNYNFGKSKKNFYFISDSYEYNKTKIKLNIKNSKEDFFYFCITKYLKQISLYKILINKIEDSLLYIFNKNHKKEEFIELQLKINEGNFKFLNRFTNIKGKKLIFKITNFFSQIKNKIINI